MNESLANKCLLNFLPQALDMRKRHRMELERPLENDPIEYVRREFDLRRDRRPEYSLRAFARDLNLSPSTMSEILNGKVGISPQSGRALAKKLRLASPHDEHFYDLVSAKYSRNKTSRQEAQIRARARSRSSESQISLDQFQLISDWHHFAILELADLSPKYHSAKSLVQALSLDLKTIDDCLQRLQRLQLLDMNRLPWSTATSVSDVGGDQIPSSAIRKYHQQLLKKALLALEEQSVDEREFQSSLFCIDSKDLPKIKEDIDRARTGIVKKYNHRTSKNAVYHLGLQFFRIHEVIK